MSRRQDVAIFRQETDQATVMIEMAMADDQRIGLGGIGFEDADIVEQCIRAVTEIEKDRALFGSALRFQIERQAPLIVQHLTIIGATARPRRLALYRLAP